jgi:hypothetical protein
MTDAQARAMETALLLAGWPPDQQDRVIGDALQRAMRKHGLTAPTREMVEHVVRVCAFIGELERRLGHA